MPFPFWSTLLIGIVGFAGCAITPSEDRFFDAELKVSQWVELWRLIVGFEAVRKHHEGFGFASGGTIPARSRSGDRSSRQLWHWGQ